MVQARVSACTQHVLVRVRGEQNMEIAKDFSRSNLFGAISKKTCYVRRQAISGSEYPSNFLETSQSRDMMIVGGSNVLHNIEIKLL